MLPRWNRTELEQMVKAIREVEVALGDGVKRPTESETEEQGYSAKEPGCCVSHRSGTGF